MKQWRILTYLLLLVLLSCQTTKHIESNGHVRKQVLTEEEQRAFDYHFYEGIRLKEEGKYKDAYESFLSCKSIDSLDTGLIAEIAIMKLALGNLDEAIIGMQQAVKQEPNNWWYNTNLLNMYVQSEKYDEAIAIGESLLKKYPEKEYAYNVLILLYKETDQLSKAIVLYDKLEQIIGISERTVFEKIGIYLSDQNFKKAQVEIDKIIQKFPLENKYKILKADLLMQQGSLLDAYELYQQILKDEPRNPYVYVSLSEYYKAINNPDESLKYIVMALKSGQLDMNSKLDILSQHIEHILRAEGEIEETENLFKLLVEYYPLEEAVHGYYAAFLQHMKRDEEAVMVYESMLNINPSNKQTWLNIIQIYFFEQNYPALLHTANRALEVTGDELLFHLYKGLTLELMEEYEQALETYLVATSLFKSTDKAALKSDIFTHLGDVCMKLSKTEEAFKAYEEAIQMNAGNLIALNNYAYSLSTEKGDLQKAERMSAKTVEREPRNSTYLDTYAWIFYQQGNYSLAKFYIERAIDNLKDTQDQGIILDHYGDILWMSKENDEKALEVWKKAFDSGYQTDALKAKIENKGWERE